jgi:hypothetical protein
MKSKAPNLTRKNKKKLKTEAEKEEALVELIIRMIVEATLKEIYEENQKIEKDKNQK